MATRDKTPIKESRLQRWSRLKQEEKQSSVDVSPTAVETDAADEVPEIQAEDLPDIESLDQNSDYTAFLQKGVPEELSHKALRKLWRSDPVFANVDGLNDYDEDYSVFQAIDAAVDTAYKVGRGFLSDEDTGDDAADTGGTAEEAGAADSLDAQVQDANALEDATPAGESDESNASSHSGGRETVLAPASVRKPGEGEV